MASASIAIPANLFGTPAIPAPPPWLGAGLAGLYLGAKAGEYLYEKYPGLADSVVDAILGPRAAPTELAPPAYYTYDPLAGWNVGCDNGGWGNPSTWRYGPGTSCGGLGFEPLGNWKTDELFRWEERLDLGLPGWFNVAWSATRSDGVVAPLPPETFVPGGSATRPLAPPRAVEVPAVRDWARVATVEEALGLAERGYSAPVVSSPELVRPDAYAANPGITFGWTYVPSRPSTVVPAVPGIPVARPGTVVVPVPGTNSQTNVVPRVDPFHPDWVPPPRPAPPSRRTKEKKGRMSIAGAAASVPGGSQALRLFNLATEFCDAVDALWGAIPFEVKLKRGFVKRLPKSAKKQEGRGFQDLDKKNFSQPGCLRKAAQVNEAWKDMHLPTAVKNLIQEHLEDMAIGKLAQKASKAHSAVQRRLRSRGASPLLGPTL